MTVFSQIEIFRTNLMGPMEAGELKQLLLHRFPGARISFDLEDCDRILRMVTDSDFDPGEVIRLAASRQVLVEVLE